MTCSDSSRLALLVQFLGGPALLLIGRENHIDPCELGLLFLPLSDSLLFVQRFLSQHGCLLHHRANFLSHLFVPLVMFLLFNLLESNVCQQLSHVFNDNVAVAVGSDFSLLLLNFIHQPAIRPVF
jgi:hypothetical protein